MAFIAADSYHSTIASIAGGTGITSFTVTSASGLPTLGTGDWTVLRLDDLGTPEDITVTAISGTTITCSATASAHANGNTIDGAILTTAALAQIKDDAISGFPENALSAAGALTLGDNKTNHITLTSAAATFTLANGTYKGQCCRAFADPTTTKLITVDPAGSTTIDGNLTVTLMPGEFRIWAWDGSNWVTRVAKLNDAGYRPLFVPNNYYMATSGLSGATASSNNTTTRWFPFYVPYPMTFAQIGQMVRSASAAGNFNCAIYAADPTTGYPTGSALTSTGNLSTGSGSTVVMATVNYRFAAPGWYWFGLMVDNSTATFVGFNANASDLQSNIGVATPANMFGTSTSALLVTSTTTYGTWPTNPTMIFTQNSGISPVAMWQVGSIP